MTRQRVDDEGATLVEFTAAITLAVVLLLGVVQVALYAYAGNVARHAAHEAARTGAELGRRPADAEAVARRVLGDGLGSSGRGFRVETARGGGMSLVVVSGHAPRVLPLPVTLTVVARSQVPLEGGER